MPKRKLLQTTLPIAAILALLGPGAATAAQRTFVSAGSGSDSNSCTRQFPCRNFAAAIAQTDPGGEVVVLDSGGFGPVTISQSVALVAPPGVHAAITAFSGNAITISATGFGADVIIIRGLYLSGLGGAYGIEFGSGDTLHVENCVVTGFFSYGIYGYSDGADSYVKNTISRDNGAAGFAFATAINPHRASLEAVRAENNLFYGIASTYGSVVSVTNGVAAGNGDAGFLASNGSISLENCMSAFNLYGVQAINGTARVANTMITGNSTGVIVGTGGSTVSFGNNRLHGNTTEGTFTSTIGQQ
jgi:hypothetical protein